MNGSVANAGLKEQGYLYSTIEVVGELGGQSI